MKKASRAPKTKTRTIAKAAPAVVVAGAAKIRRRASGLAARGRGMAKGEGLYLVGGGAAGYLAAPMVSEVVPSVMGVDPRYVTAAASAAVGFGVRSKGYRRTGSALIGFGLGCAAHALVEAARSSSGTGDAFAEGFEPSAESVSAVSAAVERGLSARVPVEQSEQPIQVAA